MAGGSWRGPQWFISRATCYGNPLNVQRTVRKDEAAGVAAIHLEDQVYPRKCRFFAGKQVIPLFDLCFVAVALTRLGTVGFAPHSCR